MMKTILAAIIILMFFSCKQVKDKSVEANSNYLVSVDTWPKTSKFNSNTQEILDSWTAYKAFDEGINNFYTIENREDLNLIIEDLVEKYELLKSSKFPAEYDKSQIKSRLKVVHTFILKTKGNLDYGLDPEEPVIETLNAYNALRNQLNIISNNTFDIKTLLDEN